MALPFTVEDFKAAYARHPEIKPERGLWVREKIDVCGGAPKIAQCCPLSILVIDRSGAEAMEPFIPGLGSGYAECDVAAKLLGDPVTREDAMAFTAALDCDHSLATICGTFHQKYAKLEAYHLGIAVRDALFSK